MEACSLVELPVSCFWPSSLSSWGLLCPACFLLELWQKRNDVKVGLWWRWGLLSFTFRRFRRDGLLFRRNEVLVTLFLFLAQHLRLLHLIKRKYVATSKRQHLISNITGTKSPITFQKSQGTTKRTALKQEVSHWSCHTPWWLPFSSSFSHFHVGRTLPWPAPGPPAQRVHSYTNTLLLVEPPWAVGPIRTVRWGTVQVQYIQSKSTTL